MFYINKLTKSTKMIEQPAIDLKFVMKSRSELDHEMGKAIITVED